jgi:hypothetical protein
MRTFLAYAAFMVAGGLAACSSPEKQLESDRRYISITYTDTTFESFGRTDRAITGLLVEHSTDSVRFRIHTTPDALVSMVDITLHPASDRGERPRTRRVGMPKATLPVMATSVAFLEQVLRRARVVGGDSVSIPVMLLGAQASLDVFTMIRNGSDSVVLMGPDGNVANALHLAVDQQGRILGGTIPISGTTIFSTERNRTIP